MKKQIALWLAVALVLCLTACQTQPADPLATPTPPETATPVAEVTPTPVPTPEPTPAIDLSALEPWQRGYIELLQEDNRRSREEARAEKADNSCVELYYVLYDVDKNGVPELLIQYLLWWGNFYTDLYTCIGETPTLVEERSYCGKLPSFYSCPGENGILIDAAKADFDGERHWWRKFSLTDRGLESEELLDELIGWEGEGAFAVTAHDPTPATNLISGAQALNWNYMSGEQGETPNLQPILEYMPDLSPWQEAYLDILLHPEEYEEFYAVAEHIPTDPHTLEYRDIEIDQYYFAICDVNGDGVQELLLRGNCWWSGLLLNILCYNEETGIVEDIDGPRAYPLMDNLWFYDTGYFSTTAGLGGLYTEYWRLVDDDPDRFWYGYQRPYSADYDGPRTTEIISFYGPDGEEFTLEEYYERMGEKVVPVQWQELTEETVRQAFLPTAREEVTP